MAFILSQPGKSKGILIFKHLEVNFVNRLDAKIIKRLREKYIIGVYFGFYTKLKSDIFWTDFYLAADNLISCQDILLKPRIALNGFNFISSEEISNENHVDKKYDFIFIGNSQTRKNLLRYIEALQVLSEINKGYTAIIINRLGGSIENKLYVSKVRKALSALSSATRGNITYIESMTESDPLPKDFIRLLYQQSRFLVITSRAEGAARVVGEASLNNLGVISYSKMLGGTNNHLDAEVDVLFDDFKELPSILNIALTNKDRLINYSSSNKSCYLESANKEKLIKELVNLFQLSKPDLEDELNNKILYNAFSSHLNLLDSKYSNNRTDEIQSNKKMYLFVNHLTDSPPAFIQKVRFSILDFMSRLKSIYSFPKAVLKMVIY
ncbi:hypothetical protein [Pseudoalteromonas fuliginea]|uniref:hypothetical protein n=1 Tax=Pseudoalteromonas fuliginea TaxID=1872678 RepID=UPI003176329D